MLEQETHRTILLVEDDPDIRDGIADILRGAGKTVVEAEDGQDALDKLEQVDRPCLILLDLRMPRMDGFEFLRRLNEHPDAPDFPVLVLCARQRRCRPALPRCPGHAPEAVPHLEPSLVGRRALLTSADRQGCPI